MILNLGECFSLRSVADVIPRIQLVHIVSIVADVYQLPRFIGAAVAFQVIVDQDFPKVPVSQIRMPA